MKIAEVVSLLDAKLVCGEGNLGIEVERAFASDLMSDVLTVEKDNVLLITGLANLQAIRTAEMADIPCILFVRNKKVTTEMEKLANESGITLMEFNGSMFRTSGILFNAGLKPVF